jgi:hypothetical protein
MYGPERVRYRKTMRDFLRQTVSVDGNCRKIFCMYPRLRFAADALFQSLTSFTHFFHSLQKENIHTHRERERDGASLVCAAHSKRERERERERERIYRAKKKPEAVEIGMLLFYGHRT